MESTLVRVFLNKSVIVSQLAVSVCSIIFGYLPVASSKFCWKLYNMVSSFLKIFGIIVCMDFFFNGISLFLCRIFIPLLLSVILMLQFNLKRVILKIEAGH